MKHLNGGITYVTELDPSQRATSQVALKNFESANHQLDQAGNPSLRLKQIVSGLSTKAQVSKPALAEQIKQDELQAEEFVRAKLLRLKVHNEFLNTLLVCIGFGFYSKPGLCTGCIIFDEGSVDAQAPPSPPDPVQVASDLAEMSEPYLNWNYATNIIDELRVEYDGEASASDQERSELLNEKADPVELKELAELRKEIDALSASVSEFTAIEAAEIDNLKRLAKVYEEMKPVPVVELFKQMELDFNVKLMSQISPASASKILAEMSNAAQGPETFALLCK